jgi:hypothetical protein
VCFPFDDVDVQPFVLNLEKAHQQFNLVAIFRFNITTDSVYKRISRW